VFSQFGDRFFINTVFAAAADDDDIVLLGYYRHGDLTTSLIGPHRAAAVIDGDAIVLLSL